MSPLPAPLCVKSLMRDYIHRSLYGSLSGSVPYFSREVIVGGAGGFNFQGMIGRSEYEHVLSQLYRSSERGWMTPVEIFTPWYSYAIAAYLLKGSRETGNVKVYEVGGGTGRHAINVLDYLKEANPSLYARGGISYTILEISAQLHARQSAALLAAGHKPSIARSVCMDALRVHETIRDDSPCTVTALEVLDNLPHDKVVCLVDESGRESLMETWVEDYGEEDGRRETYTPLVDPVVREMWGMMEEAAGGGGTGGGGGGKGGGGVWREWLGGVCRRLPPLPTALQDKSCPQRHRPPPTPAGFKWAMLAPTGQLMLLQALRAALPNHRLLAADYSSLPLPSVLPETSLSDVGVHCYAPPDALPGCGGPPWGSPALRGLMRRPFGRVLSYGLLNPLHSPLLVASKCPETRMTRDHGTYLSPPLGSADIFFPTDFPLLAYMASRVGGGGGAVARQPPIIIESSEFLKAHGRVERTCTLSGFNPMLDTFKNTKFMIT